MIIDAIEEAYIYAQKKGRPLQKLERCFNNISLAIRTHHSQL